jgi:hypothetical protein
VLDFNDLRAMLGHISDHAADLTARYGNVPKATIGAIRTPAFGVKAEDDAGIWLVDECEWPLPRRSPKEALRL